MNLSADVCLKSSSAPLREAPKGALLALVICVLLSSPSCKHKESPHSNESSAGVPTNPAPPPANSPNAPSANNNAPQADTPAAAPATAEPAAPQPVVVPSGTALTVRLAEDLGSRTSQSGQTFSATLDKDVMVDGQAAIPAGANVTGSVVNARPAGHLAGEATLVIKLISVNINNVDQPIVTTARSFGSKIKAKGAVKKFFGGLAKRAEGDEREVKLPAQSAYAFTLRKELQIQ
ncbi:MAG: hypothetical protein WBV69_18320 [Candidatus Sulfotelmatobacter sp.]